MKEDIIGTHQYWAVAFIDILGQRRAMHAIDFVPDRSKPDQMEQFVTGIKKVYGAVHFIQNSFQKWNQTYDSDRDRPPLIDLNEEQLKTWRKIRPTPICFQRFSDGLMIYVSLADCHERSPFAAIFSLFGSCATALLGSISGRTPIRGGIDVATGMEMNKGELYGPVVAKAYELESKVAQYPRVVVGDGCIQYLQLTRDSPEVGFKADFERKIASIYLDLLMADVDGMPTIDFLGDSFRRHIAYNLDPKLISLAHEYVISQLEDARKRRDTKLSFRYRLLLNYFEAKMGT